MKKLISLLLILIMLSTTFLTACNNTDGDGGNDDGNDDGGKDDGGKDDGTTGDDDGDDEGQKEPTSYIDILGCGYKVIYKVRPVYVSTTAKKLMNAVKDKTESELEKIAQSESAEYEIVVGALDSRSDSVEIEAQIAKHASGRYGVYAVKAVGKRIFLAGSDQTSLELAVKEMEKYISGGKFLVPENINEFVIYDEYVYEKSGEITPLTADDLANSTELLYLSVGSDRKTTELLTNSTFSYSTTYVIGCPDILAEAGAKGASVQITQASDGNGNIATVKVTSANGKMTKSYMINFNVQNTYVTNAEVVYKDGKRGIVTLVIDDGNHDTATFATNLVRNKYNSLSLSFAVVLEGIAGDSMTDTPIVTFEKKTEGGVTTYVKDEDGNYKYTENTDSVNFWKSIVADSRFEMVSHSATHKYPADDDTSGLITGELLAPIQVLKNLFSQKAYGFVIPGVGRQLPPEYFSLLQTIGYLGARNVSAATPETPNLMLNFLNSFKNKGLTYGERFGINSYAIEHYNTDGTTTRDNSNSEKLAADITYWKNYIDAALNTGSWACFCIHNIWQDTYHDSWRHYIYQSQADALFKYLDEKDDVWVATLSDAIVYYAQMSSATVSATTYKDESIEVTLRHGETGEEYNMEMTVKLAVPDNWTGAEVGSDTYEVKSDKDGKYVLVDLTPGVTTTVVGIK